MKFTRVYNFLKLFFFCFLVLSSHVLTFARRKTSKVSRTGTKSRIINSDTFKTFALSAISAFVNAKAESSVEFMNILIEGYDVSLRTLGATLQECLAPANQYFLDNVNSEKAQSERFLNTFINVIEGVNRKTIMENYMTACRENDVAQIEIFTKKQINRLDHALRKNDNPSAKDQKDLLDDITNKNRWFASIRGSNNICTYIQNRTSWTVPLSRWIDYSLLIVTCGSKKLADLLFKNKKKYENLIGKLYETGCNLFINHFDFLQIVKLVFDHWLRFYNGEAGVEVLGEAVGKIIAKITSATGIDGIRKLKKFRKH